MVIYKVYDKHYEHRTTIPNSSQLNELTIKLNEVISSKKKLKSKLKHIKSKVSTAIKLKLSILCSENISRVALISYAMFKICNYFYFVI